LHWTLDFATHSSRLDGVAGFALPPPVVPWANPKAEPVTPAALTGLSSKAANMVNKEVYILLFLMDNLSYFCG
jgi:hypothetical protein